MFIRKTLRIITAIALVSLLMCYAVLYSQIKFAALDNKTKEKLSELPSSDYGRLIDLVDFEFKRNRPGCSKLKNDPKIVIMVHSAPGNFNKRRVVRETWGAKDERSLLLFVIGAFKDAELEVKIERESRIFEDIVQGNFLDTYHNMTYKHAAVFKWFVYNCPNAKFLLKTDDDVFVNTPLVLDLLTTPSNRSQELHDGNLIWCEIFRNLPVHRNKDDKWLVTKEEFASDVYPDHCHGYTVLYSADAVLKLYNVSQMLPYFWIDDVHMTGTVRTQANLSLSMDARVLRGGRELGRERTDILNGKIKSKSHQVMFGFPDLDEGKIRKLYQMFNGP